MDEYNQELVEQARTTYRDVVGLAGAGGGSAMVSTATSRRASRLRPRVFGLH